MWTINQLASAAHLLPTSLQGADGRVIYKEMWSLFWTDVDYRLNNMAIDDRKVIRESTRELYARFYALLYAYDEVRGCGCDWKVPGSLFSAPCLSQGILGGDEVLAAALWRCEMEEQP